VIGLISCSAQKLARPATARELYCSPLFRKSLAYAELRCERVYVLSAAHGLVDLEQQVKPYERRLGRKKERQAWAHRVAGHLIDRHGRAVDYLLLAGADYAGPLATALSTYDGFREDGWHGVPRDRILDPLAGMQVGLRLRWLNDQLARSDA
jgi:uncharacterized protein DUF6884